MHLGRKSGFWIALILAIGPSGLLSFGLLDAQETDISLRGIADRARFLSSDALEGRGIGTKGLDAAADYLASQFAAAGLDTSAINGGPFQTFRMKASARRGATNNFSCVREPGNAPAKKVEFAIDKDFTPQAAGGSATFNLPLVFAGYGITSKEPRYDDYAGVDVKGKAVVILRGAPREGDPHSPFASGESDARYFHRKVANAVEHGAGAIIFTTGTGMVKTETAAVQKQWREAVDRLLGQPKKFAEEKITTPTQLKAQQSEIDNLVREVTRASERLQQTSDPLLDFEGVRADGGQGLPILYCRRSALNRVIQPALGATLEELEAKIDKNLTPASTALDAWRAVGQTSIERREVEVKNVVGMLAGDGPHADEAVVVGAHYDHLGYGGRDSLAPGVHEIHNGADDNASGAAVLVEIALQLAHRAKKLPRRVVFVAFTGEERGLVGSSRYVRDPVVPLDKTIAMFNLDMVGRLRNNKLIVHGTGTAASFDALVDRLGKQFALKISKDPTGFGPSDHTSFYAKQIPVLFFFTGSHQDYHRPSDDFEKLNVPGMQRVADLIAQAAIDMAESPSRPQFRETKAPPSLARTGSRPYFGSVPDFSQEEPGYALTGVTKGSPADRAGIRGGDVIVKLGQATINNLEDFDAALRRHKAGQSVPVVVKRGSEKLTVEVVLDPPR